MFRYQQSTGALTRDGLLIGAGYSGRGGAINQPAAQIVPQYGPIPQGRYTIGTAVQDSHLGPLALPLTPDPTNLMYGRGGFYVHGDNSLLNHTGSEGCIVVSRDIRERIAASGDNQLTVVA